MSINQLKAFTWAASLGVAGFLGWYVYDFFQHKAEISKAVSDDEQLAVLTSIPTPEPPKDDVVDYAIVLKTWHNMEWQPRETVVERGPDLPDGPPKPLYKPVSELLAVLMVQVDGGNAQKSMAQVRFLDPALDVANRSPDDQILLEGRKLTAPYDTVEVAKITRDGVLFRFTVAEGDEPRADELVETTRLDSGPRIVRVDGAAVVRQTTPAIPAAVHDPKRGGVPQETKLIADDHYLVGVNDRDEIARDYTRILAELRFERHRDARGKPDGVEIKDVPPGSFAAKYGVKAGQVIKSVNGHPISTVNEGISFAKQNQDKYDTWVIVYEEQGKEKTKIIDTSK
jgi:hypothetical protein